MSATSSGGIEECEAGLIAASIAQLAADDAPTVENAAKMIFHHAQSAQNKDLVRELGGIPALCAVLRSNSGHHALSALNELACGNKMNCLAIVSTAGALSALVALFPYGRTPRDPHDSLSTQELSAMVINNCASFGEEACLRIVEHPCMLVALKHLARSGSCRTRCVTIGAMNCLSRCEGARESLMRVRIVEDMLLPALREAPVGAQDLKDQLVVRKMCALMALLNLTGSCDCEHCARSRGAGLLGSDARVPSSRLLARTTPASTCGSGRTLVFNAARACAGQTTLTGSLLLLK